MALEVIKKFNWLDILVIIILFRICYVAMKSGISVEFFKLLGTILAIYISLHYYTFFSDWLIKNTPLAKGKIPLDFLDFGTFLILVILGYLTFVCLRIIFYRFIKMEAMPILNKWGGLVLGVVRGFLFVGLIIFILTISTISYLKNSVADSYLGIPLFKITPTIYTYLWNNVASKFMKGEKLNQTILEVSKDL